MDYNKLIEKCQSIIDSGKEHIMFNKKHEYCGLELTHIQPGCYADQNKNINRVKIQDKSIGFSFTTECRPGDEKRIKFVHKVCEATKGDKWLTPLSKKQKPALRKIEKVFNLSDEQKKDYQNLDIHNLESVINIIKSILSNQ